MADLSDISAWFSGQCEAVLFPNGPASDPITGAGKKIPIGRGWPDPKSLYAAMALGTGNAYVSIYPMPGMERNTTRYPKVWQQKTLNTAGTVLTAGVRTITVTGTPVAGEAAVAIVGGTPYGYTVKGGDGVNQVAAGLAALIPGATVLTNVVTISSTETLAVAVSVGGTAQMELRRQQRVFGVYVWAPDPATRNQVSQALDAYFAGVERFTVAADNTSARLIYHGTSEGDELQVRAIYKRTLMYSVEYATTTTETTQTVGATRIDTTSSLT